MYYCLKARKHGELPMSDYAANWDRYYQHTYHQRKSESLWAVNHKVAAAEDYQRFKDFFVSSLPCLDLGCGTGEQAAYLKQYYAKVIGADVSPAAIEIAQQRFQQAGLSFCHFDISVPHEVESFINTNGACNVYVRGVLHQIKDNDRLAVQNALHTLLGTTGTLYINEVGAGIRTYLEGMGKNFSHLPTRMRLALLSNLPPVGLSVDKLEEWFPAQRFSILTKGNAALATNLQLADGKPLAIPSVYAVLKPIT